ncbi:tetratricopeptide repeat protein [Micromonospora sediminimaris]|uniref:tetratricopeptide repeat protein n=1 Tax=Micromonospora sediminimaris TaxID=547162 RepID=UPI0008E0D5B9|nr:tetratricopeptide repeat protein [Micromonospora sediminimaris]SFD52837.1 Tetratricopeptide repeat-containing protein [Micromonospora sediminimaris]
MSSSILATFRRSRSGRLAVSGLATVLGGSAAALANFVPAPVAAGFGLVAGMATFTGAVVWERRARASDFDRRWADLTTTGPGGENWPDDHGTLLALHPEQRVVPYNLSHDRLVRATLRWCLGADDIPVMCVVGRAGTGKTRLAIELTEHLQDASRLTGWPRSRAAVAAVECTATATAPAVLIIDDANTRTDLPAALATLAALSPQQRPRVILLARDFGKWWRRLRAEADHEVAQLLPAIPAIEVGPLAQSPKSVQQVFQRAVKAYAAWSDTTPPTVRVDEDPRHSAMLLSAAAFVAVENELNGLIAARTAVREVFQLEEQRWLTRATEANLADLGLPVLRASVIAAALFGAAGPPQAARLMRRIPMLDSAPDALIDDLALWVRNLYPQEAGDRWLRPHLPARLVEGYVVDSIREHPGLLEAMIADADVDDVTEALTFLCAASSHTPAAAHVLLQVVGRDPARFLPTVIERADLGEVDTALAEFAAQCPLSDQDLADIQVILPNPALSCAATAAVLCRRWADTAANDEERAARLFTVSHRLWEAGNRTEAINVIGTVCDVFEAAADRDPDRYLPLLARSLHKRAMQLHMTNRLGEGMAAAQKVVKAYDTLMSADPDRYLGEYTATLDDLGTFLFAANRYDEAIKTSRLAVDLRRRSFGGGGTASDVFSLSIALTNLATRLGATGQLVESISVGRESQELLQRLVRIDPRAYLEEYAKSHTNMSLRYRRVRNFDAALSSAQEGVDLHRQLVKASGQELTPALGKALHCLSSAQADVGRIQEAITTGEEAVALLRDHATRRDADEVQPVLAEALNSLGVRLSAANRDQEAVEAVHAAVRIVAKLSESSDAFLRDFAKYLGNQGLFLGYLGRHDEAEPACRACVKVWEQLEAKNPGAFRSEIAAALDNLGLSLRALAATRKRWR